MRLYIFCNGTSEEITNITLRDGYLPCVSKSEKSHDEQNFSDMEPAIWFKVLILDDVCIDCKRRVIWWNCEDVCYDRRKMENKDSAIIDDNFNHKDSELHRNFLKIEESVEQNDNHLSIIEQSESISKTSDVSDVRQNLVSLQRSSNKSSSSLPRNENNDSGIIRCSIEPVVSAGADTNVQPDTSNPSPSVKMRSLETERSLSAKRRQHRPSLVSSSEMYAPAMCCSTDSELEASDNFCSSLSQDEAAMLSDASTLRGTGSVNLRYKYRLSVAACLENLASFSDDGDIEEVFDSLPHILRKYRCNDITDKEFYTIIIRILHLYVLPSICITRDSLETVSKCLSLQHQRIEDLDSKILIKSNQCRDIRAALKRQREGFIKDLLSRKLLQSQCSAEFIEVLDEDVMHDISMTTLSLDSAQSDVEKAKRDIETLRAANNVLDLTTMASLTEKLQSARDERDNVKHQFERLLKARESVKELKADNEQIKISTIKRLKSRIRRYNTDTNLDGSLYNTYVGLKMQEKVFSSKVEELTQIKILLLSVREALRRTLDDLNVSDSSYGVDFSSEGLQGDTDVMNSRSISRNFQSIPQQVSSIMKDLSHSVTIKHFSFCQKVIDRCKCAIYEKQMTERQISRDSLTTSMQSECHELSNRIQSSLSVASGCESSTSRYSNFSSTSADFENSFNGSAKKNRRLKKIFKSKGKLKRPKSSTSSPTFRSYLTDEIQIDDISVKSLNVCKLSDDNETSARSSAISCGEYLEKNDTMEELPTTDTCSSDDNKLLSGASQSSKARIRRRPFSARTSKSLFDLVNTYVEPDLETSKDLSSETTCNISKPIMIENRHDSVLISSTMSEPSMVSSPLSLPQHDSLYDDAILILDSNKNYIKSAIDSLKKDIQDHFYVVCNDLQRELSLPEQRHFNKIWQAYDSHFYDTIGEWIMRLYVIEYNSVTQNLAESIGQLRVEDLGFNDAALAHILKPVCPSCSHSSITEDQHDNNANSSDQDSTTTVARRSSRSGMQQRHRNCRVIEDTMLENAAIETAESFNGQTSSNNIDKKIFSVDPENFHTSEVVNKQEDSQYSGIEMSKSNSDDTLDHSDAQALCTCDSMEDSTLMGARSLKMNEFYRNQFKVAFDCLDKFLSHNSPSMKLHYLCQCVKEISSQIQLICSKLLSRDFDDTEVNADSIVDAMVLLLCNYENIAELYCQIQFIIDISPPSRCYGLVGMSLVNFQVACTFIQERIVMHKKKQLKMRKESSA